MVLAVTVVLAAVAVLAAVVIMARVVVVGTTMAWPLRSGQRKRYLCKDTMTNTNSREHSRDSKGANTIQRKIPKIQLRPQKEDADASLGKRKKKDTCEEMRHCKWQFLMGKTHMDEASTTGCGRKHDPHNSSPKMRFFRVENTGPRRNTMLCWQKIVCKNI